MNPEFAYPLIVLDLPEKLQWNSKIPHGGQTLGKYHFRVPGFAFERLIKTLTLGLYNFL